MITLEDVMFVEGQNNTPGLVQELLLIPLSSIDKTRFPNVVQPDPTKTGTLEDLVTVKGDIFIKNGQKAIKVYLTDETGELKDELQGELDGKSFRNLLEFFHPGESKEIMGLTTWLKNNSCIIVCKSKEGTPYLFGTLLSPAKMVDGPGTKGKAPADRKGRMLTLKFDAGYPTPVFEGTVRDERNTSASGDDTLYELLQA